MPKNQYLNLDILNESNEDMLCSKNYEFPNFLLDEPAKNYRVSVIRADYSTSKITTFYNDEDLPFIIRSSDGNTTIKTGKLDKGSYDSINIVLKQINDQILTVGQFSFNETLDKLEYTSVFANKGAVTQRLWLSPKLYYFFAGFDYEKVNVSGVTYFSLMEAGPKLGQNFSTTSRFYNARTIRIIANGLGQDSFIEHSNRFQNPVSSLLLSDSLLTGDEKSRLLYVPNTYKYLTLNTNSKINNLSLSVEVLYSNGTILPLYLAPGSSFFTNILFERIE